MYRPLLPSVKIGEGGGSVQLTQYKTKQTITILSKSWPFKKKFNFKHFSLWLIIGCVPCFILLWPKNYFNNFPVLRFLEAYAKCVIRTAVIRIIIIILSISQSKSWIQKKDSFKYNFLVSWCFFFNFRFRKEPIFSTDVSFRCIYKIFILKQNTELFKCSVFLGENLNIF